MARTEIPVTGISRITFTSETAFQTADPTNDNFIINDGVTFLHVNNTNAAARTFDIQVISTVDDTQSVSPRTYTVPGLTAGFVGVFPREFYGETLLVDTTTTDLQFAPYSLLG